MKKKDKELMQDVGAKIIYKDYVKK